VRSDGSAVLVITVYVSIGNSDDKLSQRDWAQFLNRVQSEIREAASAIHGEWYSAPGSPFQNACFCAEIAPADAGYLKTALKLARTEFGQDSVAWAETSGTEFT